LRFSVTNRLNVFRGKSSENFISGQGVEVTHWRPSMAAASKTDTIDCSFKLTEFWVPAAISAACGVVALFLGIYFLATSGLGDSSAMLYSGVNVGCSIPFFAIAASYMRLVSSRYRMEIDPRYILWPLPNAQNLHPLSRRHVRIPNTDVASVSIMGTPDGGRGLVLLVRKNGRRFLVGLPSLATSPARLAQTFRRNGYKTSLKITDGAGSAHRS